MSTPEQMRDLMEEINVIESGDHLKWAIYSDTSAYESEDWIKDTSTDAPTGIHPVYYKHIDTEGRAQGIVVRDGQIDIKSALAAVKDARDQTGYWGSFLERLDWDAEQGTFIATIGS